MAEELERDTVPWASRALAEEFALDTGEAGPLALWDDKIVFALAIDWGLDATELVLDNDVAGVAALRALVIEFVRDKDEAEPVCDLGADLAEAEETMEEVLARFAGPVERTVAVEFDLDIESEGDLGLETDLMLGAGSSR